MLFEEQNIQWKHLYNCAKIAQSLHHNIRPLFALGLLCFYSNVRIYLTCQQQITPSSLTDLWRRYLSYRN